MSMSKYITTIPTEGSAGNVYAIIGTAIRLMRDLGEPESAIEDMRLRAMSAHRYADACAVVREFFPLEGDDD